MCIFKNSHRRRRNFPSPLIQTQLRIFIYYISSVRSACGLVHRFGNLINTIAVPQPMNKHNRHSWRHRCPFSTFQCHFISHFWLYYYNWHAMGCLLAMTDEAPDLPWYFCFLRRANQQTIQMAWKNQHLNIGRTGKRIWTGRKIRIQRYWMNCRNDPHLINARWISGNVHCHRCHRCRQYSIHYGCIIMTYTAIHT